MVGLQDQGVVTEQLFYGSSYFCDMCQRCGEVVVHGDYLSRFDKSFTDDMFCGASLVGRQEKGFAQNILHGF